MKIGRIVLSWVLRHAFALVVIIAILIVARHFAGPSLKWLDDQSRALRTLPAQQAAYADAQRDFDSYAGPRRTEAAETLQSLGSASEARLRARLDTVGPRIARQQAFRLSSPRLALAAARGNSQAVFDHYRAGAEIALIEQEGRHIEALLRARTMQRERLRLDEQRRAAVRELRTSHADWLAAREKADQLEGRAFAGPRNAFCRASPLNVGCRNYAALVAARRDMAAAVGRNREARARLAAIAQAQAAMLRGGEVLQGAGAVMEAQQAALAEQVARLDETARRNLLVVTWSRIKAVLPAAVLILAVAIASPLLIKAVLFFGVAPLATRRPPLVLLATDQGKASIAAASAVSQTVTLHPHETLLVLPEAVQSTPHHAAKRTRWLLSWAMPLSSLASGMVALTGIRLERPDTILVSATGGPLNEIALVQLEEGSALVLRPRALRGLAHPASRPVRITRRWRLGLSAWLTLQFRYLIFHGPCTLVVEGARGVRLEHAGPGRGVNQAATIGFSAGLAYGVSRSETFGAYLLGKQALFNDSFQSTHGFYLYEEMPTEFRKGGIWRGGLRGLGDAALKLVGI